MRNQLRHVSWFGGGLAVILIGAFIPRLLSYDFSLPYVDHPDEPNWYLAGQEWRDPLESYRTYLGDPPVYIALNVVVQSVLEANGAPGLAPAVQVLRLISVSANLLTLVLIALTARLAAGDVAGCVAGLAWGMSPLVLENGVYALPDPLVYGLVALAMWLAAVALVDQERQHWCVWSTLAGLAAVLVKYPVLSAVAPGGIATLVVLARDRRLGLRFMLVEAAVSIVVILWLFLIYGLDISAMQREAATARDQGLANMLDLSRLANNLYYAVAPINAPAFAMIGVLGLLAFVCARRRALPVIKLPVAAICVVILVTIPWLAAAFSLVSVEQRLRDVIPATAAASALMGMAVGQIIYVIPTRYRVIAGAAIAGLLMVLVFVPQAVESWRLVEEREPPDRRVALRQWMDVNLELGTVLVTAENHKTFNPFWGGIPYRHWTDWWMMDYFMQHSPEEWREAHGISYAVIPLSQWTQMQYDVEGRGYLARMLHLRDFVTPDERGPEMVVYRLWRMDVATQIGFGEDIVLVGYDQSAEDVKPGESVTLRFYWQAAALPDDNYSLFVHLTPLDEDTVLSQADGSPAVPERPTLTWDDPGETLISPAFTLKIPADVPAGDYRVMIGLYNYTSGQRLAVRDGGGAIVGDAWEMARMTVGAG
jgi:4-amino-4-deoxy-L-arabinose transferase-like glycosyltransferase